MQVVLYNGHKTVVVVVVALKIIKARKIMKFCEAAADCGIVVCLAYAKVWCC